MKNILLLTLLVSGSLLGKHGIAAPEIFVAHSGVLTDGNRPNDLASLLFDNIKSHLAHDYRIQYVQAEHNREWRLLTQHENYCIYNKTPTVQRQQVASFSQQILLTFPPNRLISRLPLGNGQNISVKSLLIARQITIGLINGRSYGEALDELIATNPRHFYMMRGNNKATRLYGMLEQGKVDAVVEFTMAFTSATKSSAMQNYHVLEVDELHQYVDGYIACSDSPLGNEVVSRIDQYMLSDQYREYAVAALKHYIPEAEQIPILKRLDLMP